MTCLIVTYEHRNINLSITGERITFTMYYSQSASTSDHLISHCIQPEIVTHQNFARAGIRSRFDSGRVQF